MLVGKFEVFVNSLIQDCEALDFCEKPIYDVVKHS